MGDFTDLAILARAAGLSAAAVLGINPLHALFAAEPLSRQPLFALQPYSSRLSLHRFNRGARFRRGRRAYSALMQGEWFRATHWAARSAEMIDYGAVSACKRPVLEVLFRRFQIRELGADASAASRLGQSFRDFQQSGGQSLSDFAVFEAFHEHYFR